MDQARSSESATTTWTGERRGPHVGPVGRMSHWVRSGPAIASGMIVAQVLLVATAAESGLTTPALVAVLALAARRLARDLAGDLRLEPPQSVGGAELVLRLPQATGIAPCLARAV